ncbi:hypothetical protein CASFOL_022047 [Castilleja foliolosa]|uniref:F-box domain-containing protein n=1 Tax=Castilleja foliolosa TaxID=1961234 RepID=A0ABD3CYB0_9LAMI
MNKQSVKRREEDDDGSEITIDRLSQLPQPILHNILSLLSQKKAVRTSVLSKSWRYLWHSRLNVEFRDKWFAKKKEFSSFTGKTSQRYLDGKNEFWSFIDKTLQRYLDQNLSLQKFVFDMFNYEVDFVLRQKFISMAIMNMGVKSLELLFHNSSEGKDFPLPLVVFQSEFLVELVIHYCDLSTPKSTDNVMLNNLRTLRLHNSYITDEVVEKIISGCPLIENLDLLYCCGLKSIKLPKHCNIKNFAYLTFDEIIIETENAQILERVCIRNCRDWFLCHRNTYFPHLKSLILHYVQLPETFDNFSSFFPCLSELVLDSCRGLKEFRLLSSSIKRLTIDSGLRNRIKAFIDTPNIRYFEYSGHGFLPSIKFTATSNKWKSQITLWSKLQHSDNDDDATSWFLKLNKLLKVLSTQSHITLSLDPNEYKKLHINDSYGGFYEPVIVEHLTLRECCFSYFDPAILNCFFRIFRPCYIQFDSGRARYNLAGYISRLIPDEAGRYFWLQDLEEVSTEVGNMEANEWHCVKGTSYPALSSQQRIRYRLTWKEQLSKFT